MFLYDNRTGKPIAQFIDQPPFGIGARGRQIEHEAETHAIASSEVIGAEVVAKNGTKFLAFSYAQDYSKWASDKTAFQPKPPCQTSEVILPFY